MKIKYLLQKLLTDRIRSIGPGVGKIDEKTKLMSQIRVFYG